MPEPPALLRFMRRVIAGSRARALELAALDFRLSIAGLVDTAGYQGLQVPPDLVADAERLAAWVEAAGKMSP